MWVGRVLRLVLVVGAPIAFTLLFASAAFAQGETSAPPIQPPAPSPTVTSTLPTPPNTPVSRTVPGPSPVVTSTPPLSPTSPPRLDWDIPNGHFFTQANGFPLGSSPKGFSVTDDQGALFWTEFRRLGGVDAVGYPVSRRFQFGGFTLQAMQKGVLQWRPEMKKAWFVNVFDLLHDVSKDGWLLNFRSVPQPLDGGFDKGKNWEQVMKGRWALLDPFPAIKKRYWAEADALNLFGLPMSKVEDMGTAYVVRLQRVVIQQWKIDVPWAKAGDVTVANGGDVAKEAELFPVTAMEPTFAPDGTWAMTSAYKVSGKSTWYGSDYHGRIMANGQVYDMSDPTTVASNMYPFGTKLKVSNVKAGASIIVLVKDTGAFRYPIVTDLSQAAFAKLANPAEGTINVLVEVQP